MQIAIHNSKGSFSDGWISYCERLNIPYKLVNAYDSNIVEQVKDCSAFMWHHHHANYKDTLFAKQLLYSLEQKGILGLSITYFARRIKIQNTNQYRELIN